MKIWDNVADDIAWIKEMICAEIYDFETIPAETSLAAAFFLVTVGLIFCIIALWELWQKNKALKTQFNDINALLKLVESSSGISCFKCHQDGSPVENAYSRNRYWLYNQQGNGLPPGQIMSQNQADNFMRQWRLLGSGEVDAISVVYKGELAGLSGEYEMCAARGGKNIFYGFIRDVSKVSELTQKLKFSEFMLHSILAVAPCAVTVKDVDERFQVVMANSEAEIMYETVIDDMVGKNDFEFLPINAAQQIRDDDKAAMNNDKIVHSQATLILDSGQAKEYQFCRQGVLGPDNRHYLITCSQDISPMIMLKNKLQDEQSFAAAVWACFPGYMWVKNIQNNFQYEQINKHFGDFAGVDPLQIAAQSDQELFPASVVQELAKADLAGIRQFDVTECQSTVTNLTRETQVWHSFMKKFSKSNRNDYLLGMALDITKMAELQANEQEKTQMLQSIAMPLILFDEAHKQVWMNEAAQLISDSLAQPAQDKLLCDEKFCPYSKLSSECPIKRTFESGQSQQFAFKQREKDYRMVTYPIAVESKVKYVLLSMTDVTELTQNKRVLSEVSNVLGRIQQEKEFFLKSMEWDLRTQISVMTGLAGVLALPDCTASDHAECSKEIARANDSIGMILENMYFYSQAHQPQYELSLGGVDVNAVLKRCQNSYLGGLAQIELNCLTVPNLLLSAGMLQFVLSSIINDEIRTFKSRKITISSTFRLNESLEIIFESERNNMEENANNFCLETIQRFCAKNHGTIDVKNENNQQCRIRLVFCPVKSFLPTGDLK